MPHQSGHHRRAQQDIDQEIVELDEKPLERPTPLRGRQLVGAVALKALCGLLVGEPLLRDIQRLSDILNCASMPERILRVLRKFLFIGHCILLPIKTARLLLCKERPSLQVTFISKTAFSMRQLSHESINKEKKAST